MGFLPYLTPDFPVDFRKVHWRNAAVTAATGADRKCIKKRA
jgi:hypothetical protein